MTKITKIEGGEAVHYERLYASPGYKPIKNGPLYIYQKNRGKNYTQLKKYFFQ